MKKFKFFSLVIAMLFCIVAFAQQKTITGVVSESGLPLPGATVSVKGTARSVSTDYDGKYSISAEAAETLVFSFIGLKSKEKKVGTSTVINIELESDSQTLDAVVVNTYQTKTPKSRRKQSKNAAVVSSVALAHSNVMIRGVGSVKEKPRRNKHKNASDIVMDNTNSEDYGVMVENVFESPKSSPLSTFSIDVDNASYTNIRRMINNGQKVPKDAVRIEEMMNFFKYDYKQPTTDHPFSIQTEMSECPWNPENNLLKIGLQGKNIVNENLPASNLVFLIDVSGSMSSENKLPLLKQSMKVLVSQLRKEDKVSIVVYAGAAGMVLPPTSGDKKMTIIDALEKLSAGGSTAGGAGIQLAYKTAKENFIKGGNNRVVLATDGDFNVGGSSDNDMQRLIEEERKSGVFLTCLGFGMGNYKDSKMETLANKGNGNYAYIDNIQEANRFLGKEFKGSMFAIAKDVKIQIEFNPALVQAYRLIGYENRKLRPEDFKNDEIDAGELGSGHTVTALYEIIPTNAKSKFFKEETNLKYTKPTASTENSGEMATIKFRYKKPDGNKSLELTEVIKNKVTIYKSTLVIDFWFLNLVIKKPLG